MRATRHWGGGGTGATNREHVARGTLSAGWLLCDKSPFVLTEERISNLQLLQMKSAGASGPRPGRPGNSHCFSCVSADNTTLFRDSGAACRGKESHLSTKEDIQGTSQQR